MPDARLRLALATLVPVLSLPMAVAVRTVKHAPVQLLAIVVPVQASVVARQTIVVKTGQ
jgi:hypothetical protein